MTKREDFLEQIRELDIKIAEMELLREELYFRVDEEIAKDGRL